MSGFQAWIAVCRLRGAGQQQEYKCTAAVWADGNYTARDRLEAYFGNKSHALMNIEECVDAPGYISRYGQLLKIGALAQSVHPRNVVSLGEMTAVASAQEAPVEPAYTGENPEASCCLALKEHQITPLENQSARPFWDREWIAPDLKNLLFTQPKDDLPLATYCIFGAGLWRNLDALFDVEGTDIDVPIRCLFRGEAQEDLKNAAPYLADLTLPDEALKDNDLVPRFHKALFGTLWGQSGSIFIRTTASFEDVWRHFRKFTKVPMLEDGRHRFFLFYDPRVLLGYLSAIRGDAGKVRCFCTNDADQPFQLIMENGPSGAVAAVPDMTLLQAVRRPRFTLSYADLASFRAARKEKRLVRMVERIRRDFEKELADWTQDDLTARVKKTVERFNGYGFRKQQHLHYFVVWSVFFGEQFENQDPQGLLKKICLSNQNEDERFIQFKIRFDTFSFARKEAV